MNAVHPIAKWQRENPGLTRDIRKVTPLLTEVGDTILESVVSELRDIDRTNPFEVEAFMDKIGNRLQVYQHLATTFNQLGEVYDGRQA